MATTDFPALTHEERMEANRVLSEQFLGKPHDGTDWCDDQHVPTLLDELRKRGHEFEWRGIGPTEPTIFFIEWAKPRGWQPIQADKRGEAVVFGITAALARGQVPKTCACPEKPTHKAGCPQDWKA